jgi:hypothetical protein
MENEQNVVNDVPTTPVIVQTPPKKSTYWWVVLLVLFFFIVANTLVWFFYLAKDTETEVALSTNTETEVEKEEQKEEEITEELEVRKEPNQVQKFTGVTFSTMYPAGWRIVEYLDGDGSDMLYDEENYSGLTGLKIFNGLKEIFSMKGVTGIGFVGCPELARFDDYSETYEQEQQGINNEVQMETEVLDYTNTTYSAFKWFSKDFRRVGRFLFYDVIPNNQYFEPQCEVMFLPITEFTYIDSYGYESHAYLYTINEDVTEAELKKLDEILANMVIIP